MPRCRHCKQKFEVKKAFQKYCLIKEECIRVWLKERQTEQLKQWTKRKRILKPLVYTTDNKKVLQAQVNKIARLIDLKFGLKCIDCSQDYGNQQDAGHYHSRGAHPSLRYHLDNIHSQTSQCNNFQSGRPREYYEGLGKRYGQEYADWVDTELPLMFQTLKLTPEEVDESKKVTAKIIRNFDLYSFQNARHAREVLNSEINIYKKD